MSVNLQGLEKYCGPNRGGYVKVEYAPVNWFASIPDRIQDNGTVKGFFSFTENSWLSAFVIPSKNLYGLDVKTKRTDFGIIKTVKFSGRIITDNEAIQNELSKMEQYRFILRVTDKNGRIRILGSKNQPISFEFDYTNKRNVNTYSIVFEGDMSHTPYIYNTL